MYRFNSRVRYSEVDSSGRLKLEALLDYFQDSSTFHGEDLGVGMEFLAGRNRAWVLSAWQIVVNRYPRLCENINIGTAPYDFKGFFGYRNYLMRTGDGECLACANTLWTLVDTAKGSPVKVGKEMMEAYALEERLDMEYASRKIAVPRMGGKGQEPIKVRRSHLDMNCHVNNGQYVRIALEYLPEGFETRQMRAEYKKQAVLGDGIYPVLYDSGDGLCTVSLNDGEGRPYCVVEFMGRQTLKGAGKQI